MSSSSVDKKSKKLKKIESREKKKLNKAKTTSKVVTIREPFTFDKPKEKSKETKENEIITSLKNLMRARIESDLKNKRSSSIKLDQINSAVNI